MQFARIPRLGWLGMALVTTCAAIALIGALFLHPATANAAGPAVNGPPLTGSPSIARPNNHYNTNSPKKCYNRRRGNKGG
jgi:hypothetical protein